MEKITKIQPKDLEIIATNTDKSRQKATQEPERKETAQPKPPRRENIYDLL